MTMQSDAPIDPPQMSQLDEVPEVSPHTLSTYSRLWQLETWLRRMVYIELRALLGDDWSKGIKRFNAPFAADKRLIHMPTPEAHPLSYISFSELTRLILENWDCFSLYLPPKNIWEAKLDEVSQIRNRIAHFRSGHEDDLTRVRQLLRDMDRGFWTFCTSYNNPQPVLPASDDPLTAHFLPHDPFPWTETSENHWVRIGSAPRDMIISVTVEVLRRPWAKPLRPVAGAAGYLYDVHLGARDSRHFDYVKFLAGTINVHNQIVHVCLSQQENLIRLTIPALLGSTGLISLVERALDVALHVVDRGRWPTNPSAQMLADQWPEYVLGPDNPLTFLSPDMDCRFFGT